MKTLTLNKIDQTVCVRMLMVSVIATAFLYVYLVNTIAFNAASHESMMSSISVIQSEIGGLENDLITQNRDINKSLAVEFGLVKTVENEALIVTRDKNTRLTLNE